MMGFTHRESTACTTVPPLPCSERDRLAAAPALQPAHPGGRGCPRPGLPLTPARTPAPPPSPREETRVSRDGHNKNCPGRPRARAAGEGSLPLAVGPRRDTVGDTGPHQDAVPLGKSHRCGCSSFRTHGTERAGQAWNRPTVPGGEEEGKVTGKALHPLGA